MEDPEWKELLIEFVRNDESNHHKLKRLASQMKSDFPDESSFESGKSLIMKMMRPALKLDEQHLLIETDNIVRSRGQSLAQKELMKKRKNIQNKCYVWIEKVK
jgi:hypothetical protein